MSELLRCLGAVAEPVERLPRAAVEELGLGPPPAASEHTSLFVLSLAPYASIYVGADGLLGGDARDRTAGFWRALELTPPKEPDHLTTLLALYANLVEGEAASRDERDRRRYRTARAALLWEHLIPWLPVYLARLRDGAAPFYRRWSELLTAALAEECGSLGEPDRLPLHLRETPALVDPRSRGAEPFLNGLMAPAVSGAIVLGDDLVRCARECGAATRIGERRFVLRALWSQQPERLARSLAERFATAADDHRKHDPRFAPATEFWRRRAEATATLLRELASDIVAP